MKRGASVETADFAQDTTAAKTTTAFPIPAPEPQEQDGTKNIPDTQAWLQVALCHLINFNSFGYILSFGIFQTYYRETLHFSPSSISWIGTSQLFLLFFVGVFSGRALDAGWYRYTLFLGQICHIIGIFTTSFCREYYQLLLAQGILQGLGNGLLFAPSIALVSSYFPPNRKALPLSFLACGGATGGMVFPAIAQSLLHRIGFAWTVRCMGFVMLAVHLIVLPFSRPKAISRTPTRSWLDTSAIRDVPYLLFLAGVFLAFWGLFFAYFYVRSFAQDSVHVSHSASFTLILIINSIGIPGRIIPNYIADRYFGALNVLIVFVFVAGSMILSWIAIETPTSYYVWVGFYGFFGGGCQSLFQAAASGFADDPEKAGVRIGMVCTVVSFACLSGAPIAGKLIDVLDGRYIAAQIFGGVVMVVGSVFLITARVVQIGRKAQQDR